MRIHIFLFLSNEHDCNILIDLVIYNASPLNISPDLEVTNKFVYRNNLFLNTYFWLSEKNY